MLVLRKAKQKNKWQNHWKPRVIAEEILKEQGIELTERKIENNGWQEIPAATPAYDHPYEEESEFYYDNDSPYYQRPQHRPLT